MIDLARARELADLEAMRHAESGRGIPGVIGEPHDLGDWWGFDWGIDGWVFNDTPLIYVHKDDGTTTTEEPTMTTTAAAAPVGTEQVPDRADAIPADGPPIYGVLCPEGIRTGDGRRFSEGAMRWRDLPLPLMVQNATAPGHDGAVRVARIDNIWRDDSGPTVKIRFTGVWATTSEGDLTDAAAAARDEVRSGVLRGVSVDLDDTSVEFLDPETEQPISEEPADFLEALMLDPLMNVTDGRISGATMCSIPAFQEAYVADGVFTAGQAEPGDGAEETLSGEPMTLGGLMPDGETPCSCIEEDADYDPDCECQPGVEEINASGTPGPAFILASARVPVFALSDFSNPGLTEPTPLTVTDDGRVFGHLATWGTCHVGFDGVCVEPPHSPSGYAYFATGSVETDGGTVPVGSLTMGTGHAATRLGHRPAVAHYDDTGSCVADIAMGEDEVGIWYAGRLRSTTTPEQIHAIRAAGAVSGDWRQIGGRLETVAALVVNVPGFPIPRPALAASAGRQVSLVASGVVAPRLGVAPAVDAREVARQVLATLDRRTKVQALTRRVGRDNASRVAAALRLVHGEED